MLKDRPPGTFVVRDSNSFPGAFGLALKVATPPPSTPGKALSDPSTELVRHFLIEPTSRGVRLKGCANEPVFSKLQHNVKSVNINNNNFTIKKDSKTCSNPRDIGNIFNNYFVSVVELISQFNPKSRGNGFVAINTLPDDCFNKTLFNFDSVKGILIQ